MNEFVNMGEVENENGHDRVKVVKIRIDSRNDKQNQWQRQVWCKCDLHARRHIAIVYDTK